jgi:short-subunit dehydrogenase
MSVLSDFRSFNGEQRAVFVSSVLRLDRDRVRLASLATPFSTDADRKTEVLTADLTRKADLLRVEERLSSHASVTMLVNNAGFGVTAPLMDPDPDTWNR